MEHFRAVQSAAAMALNNAEEIFEQVNAVYKNRRDMVLSYLKEAGWPVSEPQATIYIWAPVPEKYNGSSEAFATDLLDKAGVVVTPGRAFGEYGEGFYRISLNISRFGFKRSYGKNSCSGKIIIY